MSQSPKEQTSSPAPRADYDPEVQFVIGLRDFGWETEDFARFMSPECTQLRSFVLANVKSRS